MAMSNAERQRQYRNRKRGGPPVGRWAGHLAKRKIAEAYHISRTLLVYSGWIAKHAPELVQDLEAGRARVTPTYRALKPKYDAGIARAVRDSDVTRMQALGYTLHGEYRDGDFEFWWVHPTKRRRRATKQKPRRRRGT